MRNKRPSLWTGIPLVSVGALLILAALFGIGRPVIEKQFAQNAGSMPTLCPTAIPPTATAEPLIPTRTSSSKDVATKMPTVPVEPTETIEMASAEPVEATKVTATTEPTVLAPPTQVTVPSSTDLWRARARWGVGSAGPISHYNVEPLRLGWYLDWNTNPNPARPGGIEYAQMVRLKGGTLNPGTATIAAAAQANPGSLWLVSNEPDSYLQDNVEAGTYARLYHETYTAIKAADPTAIVAIGGIIQPTPLRLKYIEAILAEYREQFGVNAPMDAWHVHNFILREERGTWGAFIPPGLPDQHGVLYEIDDSGNLDAFRKQIVDFRQWMAKQGYQNYPLIVSEYGISMPEDYGFPPERVVAFLRSTFDFFLTAQDSALGYPGDDYRLVQRWCWYSLNAPDSYYPQGRLIDPSTGEMTAIGQGWAEYVNAR